VEAASAGCCRVVDAKCYKQIFIIEVCVVWCASSHVKQRGMLDVFVIIEIIDEYAYGTHGRYMYCCHQTRG
jgi:hypothetical protein